MPGKMSVVLKNEFLHGVMKMRRRSYSEKLEYFWKKIMIYYFYVFTN